MDQEVKPIGVPVNGKEKTISNDNEFIASSWGCRHQQSLILFFTLTIAYSMRACMGVTLVAMTHHDIHNSTNRSIINDIDVDIEDFKVKGFFNTLMLSPPYPTFNWSKKIQDTLIASFFWGYMILQIPAGQLAHRFGSRLLIFGALTINCVVSILLPLAAYYGGWVWVVIFRIIQGLSQACIVPGIHTFLGKWAPLEERGRLSGIIYGGQALGTVLGLPITGFLSSSFLGWPGIFRFYGFLSGLIAVIIWLFAADTPAKHTKISTAERQYIEEQLGTKKEGNEKHLRVPWTQILRCRGLYAIVTAHCAHSWGQLTLYSEIPAFMDHVMGVNIKTNGLLTALPFVVMFFGNYFFSWFTDMLIVKKVLSVTNTRKLACSIGSLSASVGLIALAFVPKNIYVVETILILICLLKVAATLGYQVNHIDISPNFAGTMMSITNFVSTLFSSLSPILAGFILTDVNDEHLWRQVFFTSAGFYFFSNIVYFFFGTAEKAEWNEPDFYQFQNGKQEDKEDGLPMLVKRENK